MKTHLALLLCAECVHGHAQTIVPTPKPGTILWHKSFAGVDRSFAPMVDAQGLVWFGVYVGPNAAPRPIALDPKSGTVISNAVANFSAPELRLQARTAFLSDGTWIIPGLNSVSCLGGLHDWQYTTPTGNLEFGLVTKADDYVFRFNRGNNDVTEHRVVGLSGTNGGQLFDRLQANAPPWPSYQFCGFGPGGRILAIGEKDQRFTLAAFNTTTGVRVSEHLLPVNITPMNDFGVSRPFPNHLVTTEDGYVCFSAYKAPTGPGYKELGLYVVNLLRPTDYRFVVLGDDQPKITGLIAGRNGHVYVTLSGAITTTQPSVYYGGLKAIIPSTGHIAFIPDLSDQINRPPVITPDGTLLVATKDPAFPSDDRSQIFAIATGSKGGIAQSPWPRSTGDNLNSFREQGVEDTDKDGLTDEQESRVYGTNPLLADTDGDGYNDGKEVEQGSDPKNKSSIPELLEIEPAIKLSFGTTIGLRYRLQSSPDLNTWVDMGSGFVGTGVRSSVLVEASEKARYFRLWRF